MTRAAVASSSAIGIIRSAANGWLCSTRKQHGPGPNVVIAAHSLGCLLVVHWASLKRSNIAGALLVAVPDPSSPAFPSEASGFAPVPDIRLGFPTVVVASTDDPYGTVDFARGCANVWGSRFVNIGAAGHINAASGLGGWPVGFELLAQLRKAR